MKKVSLVIMAAGMGSRYGGLKQIAAVGQHQQAILDYAIYDAWKAGFEEVVFVIRQDFADLFKERIGDRVAAHLPVKYVFQDLDDLPSGFKRPEGREKPWGTAQAVLAARKVIEGPFAAINADDYYGATGFQQLYSFLQGEDRDGQGRLRLAMVGYRLGNTVTEHGTVSRGICDVNENGQLSHIVERTRIASNAQGDTAYTEDEGKTWQPLSSDSIASMNLWGFPEAFIPELEAHFKSFLEHELGENPLKAECYLPAVVGRLIQDQKAVVQVLPSEEKWYGITYPEDLASVQQAIADLTARGHYPEELWPKQA